jgi:predicted RNA methylase
MIRAGARRVVAVERDNSYAEMIRARVDALR